MESAHIIDGSTNLVGVCNVPADGLVPGRPVVVLINAGFLHRVGPNRMNTLLARLLSERGFASIRIDLSGIGDSMGRSGTATRGDYSVVSEDLDSAMRFMKDQCGAERFVLFGSCSGAYDTARKAIEDSRVVGLVNIDGVGYRTRRFYLNHLFNHLIPRIGHPKRWVRLMQRYRALAQEQPAAKLSYRSVFSTTASYTDWTLDESGHNFEKLAQRGVRMYFVYTGGVSGFYNYHGQFWDIFSDYDFNGMASTRYFPSADHLIMLEEHRQEVYESIAAWFTESYAGRTVTGV